ncbi:hypothetical protein D3C71_25340 [compost metagenome]
MHPETQYVLDCAMELGELTLLEHAVAFVRRDVIQRLDRRMERDEGLPPDYLFNETRQALDECPAEVRRALAISCMQDLPRAFEFLVSRVNVVVRNKVLRDLGLEAHPFLLIQEDAQPAAEERLFSSFSEVMPHTVQQVAEQRFAGLMRRWAQDLAEFEAAAQWLAQGDVVQRRQQAMLELRHTLSQFPTAAFDFAKMVQITRPSLPAKKKRTARSAIKKVLKLFEKTGSTSTLSALVSGSEVVISHEDSPFKFVLVPFRQDWLERATVNASHSSPFNIRLFTKTDVHLANLCVYFKDTPVLDQLFALMLFINSGQESEVLKTANWFGSDDLAQTRRVLAEVGRPELVERVKGAEFVTREDDLFSRADRHWQPYEGPVSQWLRTMLVPRRFDYLVQCQPLALAA